MLIYFDESYDQQHTYLLFGALFNPHPRFLHRRIMEIKTRHNFRRHDGSFEEIKYKSCYSERNYLVCKEVIDAFFESTSWFRSVVIKQNDLDLSYFGRHYEEDSIKRARAYKKFAEMLIASNTKDTIENVLLTDKLTRCKGDEFLERMKEIFCIKDSGHSEGKHTTTLRDIQEVNSSRDQYQVIQLCDLLLGCVLNNLLPATNQWKNEIRNYLVKSINVPSLLEDFWGKMAKWDLDLRYPKFSIWYWKPKNRLGMETQAKRKA